MQRIANHRSVVMMLAVALTTSGCRHSNQTPGTNDSVASDPAPRTTKSAPDSTATGAWLDKQLSLWNSANAAVPTAPVSEEPNVYGTNGRCSAGLPKLITAADSAVAFKGWTPVAATEVIDNMQIVTAGVEADGMCRPYKYQTFVFSQGVFAGTLSPVLMNSRQDGALGTIKPSGREGVDVSFNRYTADDPLCCPSRTTTVHYRLTYEGGKPVIIPTEAKTQSTAQPASQPKSSSRNDA